MPGLAPGIHVLVLYAREIVDGRNKSGHDGFELQLRLGKTTLSSA